jgi:trimeric autotransporter adhesin
MKGRTMNPVIQLKRKILIPIISFALACFALSPTARAVDPPPDGFYPNQNTAEGEDALFSLASGLGNTGIGFEALYSNTDGGDNTAVGDAALYNNITGSFNTAIGEIALWNNNGDNNTAIGFEALFINTDGEKNTAIGSQALLSNTTGSFNTAIGEEALLNSNGDDNTAVGDSALSSNITGFENTAIGVFALDQNTTGGGDTAVGVLALTENVSGSHNTAIGSAALANNTTGINNTAIGSAALFNNTTGINNTAIGIAALGNNTSGLNNIALGFAAGHLTTGDHSIDIGNDGVVGESNTIRVGTEGFQTRTFVAGIYGRAVSGTPVKVNSSGQLGTAPSSSHFKEEIRPMEKASEALLALKPVTFRYKKEIDPDGTPQFGLVAEDVERVNPALVARDVDGKPYTVRYEAVNAMLLNEFLKEHRKVQQLTKDFESKFAEQQKQIQALTAGLQKVSVQVEMNRTAQQMVVNNQ